MDDSIKQRVYDELADKIKNEIRTELENYSIELSNISDYSIIHLNFILGRITSYQYILINLLKYVDII